MTDVAVAWPPPRRRPAGREATLEAGLDLLGACVVAGDVGTDGTLRLDWAAAGGLVGALDVPAMETLITRMLADGLAQCDVRPTAGDGRPRWLRLRCQAVPAGASRRRLVVVCQDISEEIEGRDETVGGAAGARQDERLRFARELHDGLGQTLTSAALFARSLEVGAGETSSNTVAELRRLVEAALTETKTIMWRLRPADVEELGFEAALRRLAETFRRAHGVRVDVHLSSVDRLSPAVEAAAYRVAQEAMTNAVKHAGPTLLSVLACRRGSTLTLVVDDDGTGFDPSAGVGTQCAGILGMGERAVALGGRLDIQTSPGHGTTVRLIVPSEGIPS
jgi:signal transduction histidine kinase